MSYVPPLDERRRCTTCGEVFYVAAARVSQLRRKGRPLPSQCRTCEAPPSGVAASVPTAPPWRDGSDKQQTCLDTSGGY